MTARGKRPHDADIVVEEGQAQVLSVTLESDKKGGLPTWVWVAGGAVLVSGAAVGGYFLFRSSPDTPPTPVGTLSPGSVQASFPVRGF